MRASRPPLPPPAPTKETTFGDLTLVERLAVGGMAEVFRAREPRAVGEARTIVVKRMLPHIAAEPGAAKMFEAEARIGQLIEHRNVVKVLGFGEAEGQPYLSLELVPGVDLHRMMHFLAQTDRALPLELAVFVARELLAGLHAVHEAADEAGAPIGLVHGDVSPSNVLLSVHGDVKLADFGIAEARLRSSFPQAAAAGRTRGKLAYLAPEQLRGETNDRRSDVFAASAVATELAIGGPLFARPTDLATLLAVRSVELAPLDARAEHLPPKLVNALRVGLSVDPLDRYESADELRRALASFATETEGALRAKLASIVGEACGRAPEAPMSPPTLEEITREPPLHDHRVRLGDGRELGPWSFAQLVEAVTMGQISADDEVRVDRSLWRRIGDIEALASHIPSARTRPPKRGPGERVIDLAGGGIVEALGISAAKRESGVWSCSADEALKEVYLVEGRPDFVTSNVHSELLGEFLVARGILERGELDMALAVLPKFDGRLGDTLAALGLIEPMELLRYISEQVREKLLSLFTWESGTAIFSPGATPPARGFALGLDPWNVLAEGIDRRLAAGLEQETFALHMMDELRATGRGLPRGAPAELELLLVLLSRKRPLQEVVESLSELDEADPHRPYRTVRLALALGLVAWVTA